jgi:predicted GIY-YIG superfamily endonuclease
MGDRSRALRAEYRVKKLDREAKEQLVAGRHSLTELMAECLDGGDQVSGEAAG